MTRNTKAGIIAALVLAVAAVAALKQHERNTKPTVAAATPKLTEPIPRLVDLGAGKCIPCKMMAPVLEELRKEYAGRMEVVFIDVWENPDAGRPYDIDGIPTQIFYDAKGKELFRHSGFFGKEDILGKWKELGVNLIKPD